MNSNFDYFNRFIEMQNSFSTQNLCAFEYSFVNYLLCLAGLLTE